MLWVEKYKPKFHEIGGQLEAKEELRKFIVDFFKQRKNAAMVYGPSGTGKTAAIYALASKMNFEVVELNASDFRDKKKLHEVIGSSLLQKSLFSKGKIILIDEIEGLNSKDYGATAEIIRLLENKRYPIIFVTNDAWQEKVRKLRVKSHLIKFKSLSKQEIVRILEKIVKKEKIKVSDKVLEIIASQSQGDARAAINDLQSISIGCKDINISKGHLLCLGFREKDENIFQALRIVFKSKSAYGVFDNVQLDLNTIILWLDENIPLEYNGGELVRAYEILSIADVFRGRIIRRQYWRFLSYVRTFISQGIALAKIREKEGFTSYKPPSRILKLWIAKQKLMKKRGIAIKVAKKTHTSIKRTLQDFSFIEIFLKGNIPKDLKLCDEEIEFLKVKSK
jgi:replication factor C large subunit